ncbi:MAG: hypothetical protein ACI8X5_003535 [Planctomycetota bacterium]|jgi:hypothetical protein
MNTICRSLWKGCRGLVAVVATLPPASGQNPAPPDIALLVGINKYAAGEWAPQALSGCINDVANMQALLIERFGFDPKEIRVLLNEAATHEALIQAFDEHLLRKVRPGSTVVLYLSGHGSRIPDASGDFSAEPDGYDSTFLAYDSRADKLRGERDVTDDELRSLLSVLTHVTDQVIVISDTCHSGGIVRGKQTARSAPLGLAQADMAYVRKFWPEDVALEEDGPGTGLDPSRYLHVAAAERDQRAWELELSDETGTEQHHGAMTYFLVRALERARPETTWREVVDDTAVRVAAYRFQNVNYLGNVNREVFGGKSHTVQGFRTQVKGNGLVVRAGALVGLRTDSMLVISKADGTSLGVARVVRVTPSAARAEWVEAIPQPPPEGVLRALELSRGSEEPQLRVHLELDQFTLPMDSAFLEFVDDDKPADYVIEERGDGLYLRTEEGIDLHTTPILTGESLREKLESTAREEVRWRALCDLAAERGQYPLRASIRPATAAEAEDYPNYRTVIELPSPDNEAGGCTVRLIGGRIPQSEAPSSSLAMLEIVNTYDMDLNVGVLSLEESREISMAFPVDQGSALLAAGERRLCPISILARGEWPLDRPMRDRYIVVAWKRPFDLKQFERKATQRGDGNAAPPLLENALLGPLTRGSATNVSYRGWGISCVDVLVTMPIREQ